MSYPAIAHGDAPTGKQRDVLAFIVESSAMMGRAPTMREIGDHFGIRSTNGVNDHLIAMERRGLIEKPDLKSRAILVTPMGLATLGLRACPRCGGKGHVTG